MLEYIFLKTFTSIPIHFRPFLNPWIPVDLHFAPEIDKNRLFSLKWRLRVKELNLEGAGKKGMDVNTYKIL